MIPIILLLISVVLAGLEYLTPFPFTIPWWVIPIPALLGLISWVAVSLYIRTLPEWRDIQEYNEEGREKARAKWRARWNKVFRRETENIEDGSLEDTSSEDIVDSIEDSIEEIPTEEDDGRE